MTACAADTGTADWGAVAVCCRVLGALLYLPPNDPVMAPILASLREERWLLEWPFGEQETLARLGRDFAAALSDDDADAQMCAEYQRLFIGPNALEAPPWGSVYLEEEGTLFGDTTLALRSFLEEQGVSLNTGMHEPDDHIGLLLWATAWLAEHDCPSAVVTLFDRHLLSWSGRYLGQLEAAARHAFYRCVAQLASTTFSRMRTAMTPLSLS